MNGIHWIVKIMLIKINWHSIYLQDSSISGETAWNDGQSNYINIYIYICIYIYIYAFTGQYNCQICDKSFRTPTFLLQHYVSPHFRNELRRFKYLKKSSRNYLKCLSLSKILTKVIGIELELIVFLLSVSSALLSHQRNVASAMQPLTKTPSWWCTSEQHIERWTPQEMPLIRKSQIRFPIPWSQ